LPTFRKSASVAHKIVLLSAILSLGERMRIHKNNTIPATTSVKDILSLTKSAKPNVLFKERSSLRFHVVWD
jgi:hypothetical protein